MARTFPRDMTTWITWETPDFKPVFFQERAREGRGVIQVKDMGPILWRASFSSVPMPHAAADAAIAEFRLLRGAVNPFFVHTADQPFPSVLATATVLNGASPVVAAIGADFDELSISGVPAGLQISKGDFLSVETSAGGKELFQVGTASVADETGTTGLFEVFPPVRPAVADADAVSLVNPAAEMRLIPGTLDDPRVNAGNRRIVFEALQVIR
jgi:hypothetical protein